MASLKLDEGGTAHIGWLGDVHVMRVRDGRIASLAPPHTLADSPGIIVRALGMAPTAEPDIIAVTTHPGDVFVLGSDGLVAALGEPTIAALVSAITDCSALSRSLVDEARRRNGTDDLTVVVIMIDGGKPRVNATISRERG